MSKEYTDKEYQMCFKRFDHVYMNLPGSAIEFLDVFDGFLINSDRKVWTIENLPVVHVYTFISTLEE